MKNIIRALTIQQPWVEQILLGTKKNEFRSQKTNVRERVWLYASDTPADWPEAWKEVGKKPGSLPAGCIVGSVEIVECKWDPKEQFFAYALRNPVRLDKPLVPKNQPGPMFWKPEF